MTTPKEPAPSLVPQKYAVVPIGRIKPHPDNARKGDEDAIAESLNANGFYQVVLVQKSTGHILAGNHRWKAAKAAGMKKIPVVYLDVDDSAALKIMLSDNRTSDKGTYAEDVLARTLQTLRENGAGVSGTGYSEKETAALIKRQRQIAEDAADAAAAAARARDEAAPQLGLGLKYQIIIDCKDEFEQSEIMTSLESDGMKCRAAVF